MIHDGYNLGISSLEQPWPSSSATAAHIASFLGHFHSVPEVSLGGHPMILTSSTFGSLYWNLGFIWTVAYPGFSGSPWREYGSATIVVPCMIFKLLSFSFCVPTKISIMLPSSTACWSVALSSWPELPCTPWWLPWEPLPWHSQENSLFPLKWICVSEDPSLIGGGLSLRGLFQGPSVEY